MLEFLLKEVLKIAVKKAGDVAPEKLEDLKRKFHDPTKQYMETYLKRHGQIQVLGMSKAMSLKDVYTKVRILDAETVKPFISVENMEKAQREANRRGFTREYCQPENGMDVANAEPSLCVLGGPGIGKTTYLRKIGLEALHGKNGQYKHDKIPVFLELKNFTSGELNLKNSIAQEFETCGFPEASAFTDTALKAGSLLILLDGLDEVPSDNANRVVRAIKNLSDQPGKNRFITSCRIAAYHNQFPGFRNVAIAEFNEDQMRQFISNWFIADPNPNLSKIQKLDYGADCWQQLQEANSIGTKELSQTPLLLTFVCLVYRQSRSITNDRALLYTEALNILLKQWAEEKYLEKSWEIYKDLNPRLEKDLLAEIAYVGFEEDRLYFKKDDLAQQISTFLTDNLNAPKHLDADAVIDAIAVQQGILVERATGVYSFSHLTLQEFLCAEHVVYNLDKLVRHATESRWREVFFLATGLMGRHAIGLLEKLEVHTQELSEHPKLKGLLAWAEAKTTGAASDYSGEINRVFTLIFILALARALARASARALDLDLARARALARASARASDLARDLARDLDLALDRALDLALDRDRDLARALDRASNLARVSAKFALNKQLITNVDLPPLISYLEKSTDSSTISAKEFTSIISSSLDISPEFLDLSTGDVQAITNYLLTCMLMIDCSKQASGLSKNDWNAIQQRMFLPPQSETHKNSSSI